MTQGVPLMAGSIGKIPERTTIDQRERRVVGGRQIVEDQKPVTNRCRAQSVETRFLPARSSTACRCDLYEYTQHDHDGVGRKRDMEPLGWPCLSATVEGARRAGAPYTSPLTSPVEELRRAERGCSSM